MRLKFVHQIALIFLQIITLYSLSIFEEKAELYMVMELMDCDLHRIIQSKQPLNDMHYKCFARQMLEGIKAMHDIGVFRKYSS
jgi:serine/threonine protein kinase